MSTPNPSRVMLIHSAADPVRLAFPVLDKPEQFQGTGKPRFSGTLLFKPNGENHKKLIAALKATAAAKWGADKADAAVKAITASGKIALKDGNAKADYDGFSDMMYLAAHSQESAPPTLLDGNKNTLPRNTGVIYAGCFVNASVEIWALDKSKGFGHQLNANLRGLQYAADGDSFSAARPADKDEFEAIEGAHQASDGDFGDEGEFA